MSYNTRMVVIMRGVSGGGKSTFARRLLTITSVEDGEPLAPLLRGVITRYARASFSADALFETPSGGYVFDRSRLGEAHAQCMRKFTEYLRVAEEDRDLLIVDNTNTTLEEVVPYSALARAYGHSVHVVEVSVDPGVAFCRNIHGVPLATVDRQGHNITMSHKSVRSSRIGTFHQLVTGHITGAD